LFRDGGDMIVTIAAQFELAYALPSQFKIQN